MDTKKLNNVVEVVAADAKKTAGFIKDRAEDVYYGAKHVLDKRSLFIDAKDRLTKNYTTVEIWNFGDCLLERSADILGYLCEREYKDAPIEWFKHLRPAEDIFRAYSLFISDYITFAPMDYEVWKKGDIEARNNFVEHWNWYGENVLVPDNFHMPVLPNMNPAQELFHKASGKIIPTDITNIPVNEARRITEMLRQWAFTGVSYSEGYYKSGNELVEKDELWEERQLPLFLAYELRKLPGNEDIEMTPKNLGLDYAAWKCDIYKASEFFEEYANWVDTSVPENKNPNKHYLSNRDAIKLIAPETASALETQLTDNMLLAWKWIGKNIAGLWD